MKVTLLVFLDKAVDIWHSFLDSLSTIGGNIFILLVIWVVTAVGVTHVLHQAGGADTDAKALILSTFAGINGALMYALTQGQKGGKTNGDGAGRPLVDRRAIAPPDPNPVAPVLPAPEPGK